MLNLLGLESDEPTNLVTDSWLTPTFQPYPRYNEGIRGAFLKATIYRCLSNYSYARDLTPVVISITRF